MAKPRPPVVRVLLSNHQNTPPFTATQCDWSLDLSKEKMKKERLSSTRVLIGDSPLVQKKKDSKKEAHTEQISDEGKYLREPVPCTGDKRTNPQEQRLHAPLCI